MNIIEIRSYDELINIINSIISREKKSIFGELRGLFFRGQANKDWRLIPGLLRDECPQEEKELNELLSPVTDNKQVALAIAQHYGKKTRCLDFSRNYKVALYFACNPSDEYYLEDGALFIINSEYHRPSWFTNYLVYYTAKNCNIDVSNWEYARYILEQPEIVTEFLRTGRSLEIDDVDSEIQIYLCKGFMVDFNDADYGIERIMKQEAALYYFGSKYYTIIDNKKSYVDIQYLASNWSNQNSFRIELHNLIDAKLEEKKDCTKIIIPHSLKDEIFSRISINASDLGL